MSAQRVTRALAALILAACGGSSRTDLDAARLDASVDARMTTSDTDAVNDDAFYDSCHYDCFGYFRCLDGVVDEINHAPVPCARWTGECPHHAVLEVMCERGCREGAGGETATSVCEENVPKSEGDPCTSDVECTPGRAVPDGFGGTTELALTCDLVTGTCVRASTETCNGVDDDGDGVVDEECGCSPRVVAEGAPGVIVRGAAFALDRVAVLQGYESDVSMALVSSTGLPLGTRRGLPADGRVVRVSDGFAVLRHVVDAPDQIIVVADDGSTRVVPIASGLTSRAVFFTPFGTDWLFVGYEGSFELPLQLHAASGALLATGTLPLAMPGALRFVPRGTELAIFSGPVGGPIEAVAVDSALSVRPLGVATVERSGLLQQPVVIDGRIVMAVRDEFDLVLASLDASGTWSSSPLPPTTATMALPVLATSGTNLVMSWVDSTGLLRSIVLDATLARVGESAIRVSSSGSVGLWAGETADGARVVAGGDDHWRVVAPCDAL